MDALARSWFWSWMLAAVSLPTSWWWAPVSLAHAQEHERTATVAAPDEPRREAWVEDQREVAGGEGAEQEFRNSVSWGFTYGHSFLKDREGPEGEELGGTENLYGFNIRYERVLIPSHLAIVIAKPFLFNRERYDSPLEVVLKALMRRRSWEPFLGIGLSSNVRVFSAEREELEGRRIEYAGGLVAATGVTYIFTPHWGTEVELAYVYVFNRTSVSQHEISAWLNAVYYFERRQRR